MNKKYADDSLALHTDQYQIEMTETYFNDDIHNRKAVFELYFRKLPFSNSYALFAGLEKIINYVKDFQFSETDIEFLEDTFGFDDDFINYLKELKFTGTIRGMREGELVFGNEPILQIEAPLGEAQMIETPLLNIVNFQTLIATLASRIRNVLAVDYVTDTKEAMNEILLEFGTRRAHDFDAAIWGTRATYIAGFNATSNLRAGKIFGIPTSGTMAHAQVQAYLSDYEAFTKYAKSCIKRKNKKFIPLIDTYDTLRLGLPAAIKVAKEWEDEGLTFDGIRIDSGNLLYLSKECRKTLNENGFNDTKIFVSNDLDEYAIQALKLQKAPIDGFGVGTKLITAFQQPALGAVYKLVAIEDENGNMVDTIKLSQDENKVTTPGMKKLWRIVNLINGKSEGDYIALEDENPNDEEKLKMFHPVHTHISKFITNFEAKEVLEDIFVNGKLVYQVPTIDEVKSFSLNNLDLLWEDYRTVYQNENVKPMEYAVDLSQKCWDNKKEIIEGIKNKVKEEKGV